LTFHFTLAMGNYLSTMSLRNKSNLAVKNSVATAIASMALGGQAYIPTGNSTKNIHFLRSSFYINKNYLIQNLKLHTVGLTSILTVVSKCVIITQKQMLQVPIIWMFLLVTQAICFSIILHPK